MYIISKFGYLEARLCSEMKVSLLHLASWCQVTSAAVIQNILRCKHFYLLDASLGFRCAERHFWLRRELMEWQSLIVCSFGDMWSRALNEVCLKSVSGLFKLSLIAILAYLIGQTELKIQVLSSG